MKKIRLTTNIISIILIAIYTIYLAMIWKNIPAQIPTHFDAAGTPNSWGSKNSLLVELVIAVAAFVLIAIVERFPNSWNFPVKVTSENKERLTHICLVMIGVLKILVTCIFIDVGLSSIYLNLPVWILYLLLAFVGLDTVIGIVTCIRER